MLAIAIDSSQEICTLALGQDSRVLAEYHFYHKMNLLRRIVPNIESMLSDAAHAVPDLEGVIVSLGPGSFTGLRIGVTIAKSLAYVLQKPIVGVGTLDAIARGAAAVERSIVCPMIFARADEIYWTLFDSGAGTRLREYAVSPIDKALDAAAEIGERVLFCGTGARRNWDHIRSRLGNRAAIAEPWSDFTRGAALLAMGMKRLLAGDGDETFALAPLYVRKPTPVIRLESGCSDKRRHHC